MGNTTLIRFMYLLAAAFILNGCVSYYPYPERVYSASDNSTQYYDQGSDQRYDQSYDQSYDSSVAYGSTYYYPWWSMDYFYLGNHYYRPSLAFSFSYGSPWYSPYYGYYGYPRYYSPWYPAYYGYPYAYYGSGWSWGIGFGYGFGYGYGWSDPYWYHRYRGYDHYRHGHDHYNRGYDRGYAGYGRGYGRGNDEYGRGHGRGDEGRGTRYPQHDYRRDGQYVDRRDRDAQGNGGNRDYRTVDRGGRGQDRQMPTERRVPVTPTGPGSDRSMVVVSRGDGKPRQNRVQPIVSQEQNGQAVVRAPLPSRETRTVQQGPMRVVQPGDNKQRPSRTGMPADSARAPRGPEVVMNQPPRSNQSVVRMPRPDRSGNEGNGAPPRIEYQSSGRAPESNGRQHGGGGRESYGNEGRESAGGGREARGQRGGRGNHARD